MSDGQDKSDDLIAELAKLMASSAGGAEPEAKPGPKLVSVPEPSVAETRPAGPTIRIPGMDAPVAAAPQPAPVPAPVAPAPQAAAPAPTIRIPGMDQPVAAAPRPVAPPPVAAMPPEPKPVEHRAPTIEFGTLPPAATIRPEPLSNWQDREIPRPVAARPAVVAEPVLTAPAPKVTAPAPTPVSPASAFTAPPAPTAAMSPAPSAVPARLDDGQHKAEMMAEAHDEPVVAGKPAPEGDSFDFDFGFGDNPPGPVAEEHPVAAAPRHSAPIPAPASSTGDPIADLIAAELDAVADEPAPVPARPPVQAPAIRSFPPAAAQAQPQVQAQPQQQRAVTTNPVRPPVAPPVAQAPQPKPAAEPDRFAAAPVFGVGSRPATPAPAERDPMDEIESLIGEAVRVELSAPEKPPVAERPKSAPVVPPLTTGFAPRRAAIKDSEPQVTSAEAAILAAAAATGADVGNLDGTIVAEASASPYKRPKAKPEKRAAMSGGLRQYVGMAVAGTLLLAAGFGLYWVLGMGRTADTEAPVLTAETTPAKEPAPVVAPKEDAEGSVVFGTTDGTAPAAPADEQIVSRDASVDTSVADVAETVGADSGDTGDGTTVAATEGGESELANRKVRTVTVRPDGTIVSGEDAVAGNSALPVDRPNVPEIPGADVEPSPLLADTPAADAPVDPTTLALATDAPADTTVETLANIDPTIVAPVPMARPSDRSVLGGGSNQQVAASDASGPVDLTGGDAQPQPVAAAPAVSSASGAYVQLSSQPTSADAQASLRTTQNRLSGVLNGRSLEIRQVDLGAKGVWYRVVLPTNSFSEATQTCANFKANGTDCVAING
jgi:hypothetical protein